MPPVGLPYMLPPPYALLPAPYALPYVLPPAQAPTQVQHTGRPSDNSMTHKAAGAAWPGFETS